MPPVPRDIYAPSASGVLRGAGHEVGGFKKFLLRGNVVDLAVGVEIGAAFGGVPDFSSWTVAVGRTTLLIGDFLNALITFLLIALVVYFLVVLPVNKLMDRYRPEPQPAPTKECPECTRRIPQVARRCRECTALLAAPSEEVPAAMRQAAAPSGAVIADEAAQALAERLRGSDSRA